nr:amidohydrolase family protein [Nocardioidaceae bacterium]
SPADLVEVLGVNGHRSLGWADAGSIAPGQLADLVAVRLDSRRTAGSAPTQAVLTAAAPDVHTVVVGGRVVVKDGHHLLGDVGRLLADAIAPLWDEL